MKPVNKLVLLGLLPAIAAAATPVEEAYLATCRKDPGVPVPIAIVSPEVSPEHDGGLVNLEFTVAADGTPANFRIAFATDDLLAKTVVQAVKLWRFQPAEVDGEPVPMRVVLPVKVVDRTVPHDRFAIRD